MAPTQQPQAKDEARVAGLAYAFRRSRVDATARQMSPTPDGGSRREESGMDGTVDTRKERGTSVKQSVYQYKRV